MSVILFLLGFSVYLLSSWQKFHRNPILPVCVCRGGLCWYVYRAHVWMCILACICLCVHVKARDQHWVSVFSASVSVWDGSLKDLPVPASALSPAQGLYMHTHMPGFLSGFWGSELSSYSCSRHFTRWAVSPAQLDCEHKAGTFCFSFFLFLMVNHHSSMCGGGGRRHAHSVHAQPCMLFYLYS